MLEIFKKLLPGYFYQNGIRVSNYASLSKVQFKLLEFHGPEKETMEFWNDKWLLILVEYDNSWKGYVFKKNAKVFSVSYDFVKGFANANAKNVDSKLREVNDFVRTKKVEDKLRASLLAALQIPSKYLYGD